MKNLIFDFDGVLGDTLQAHLGVYKTFRKKDREAALLEIQKYVNKKSPHTRDHSLTENELQEMVEWMIQQGRVMNEIGFGLFTDFINEIAAITNKRMAVVSSGSIQYIKAPLLSSGLLFTHVLAIEDHHSKEEKIERICRDWNVSPKEVYYFTDTVADVLELKTLIMPGKCIGCSWGFSGYQELSRVLPKEDILENFTDIHLLFPKE